MAGWEYNFQKLIWLRLSILRFLWLGVEHFCSFKLICFSYCTFDPLFIAWFLTFSSSWAFSKYLKTNCIISRMHSSSSAASTVIKLPGKLSKYLNNLLQLQMALRLTRFFLQLCWGSDLDPSFKQQRHQDFNVAFHLFRVRKQFLLHKSRRSSAEQSLNDTGLVPRVRADGNAQFVVVDQSKALRSIRDLGLERQLRGGHQQCMQSSQNLDSPPSAGVGTLQVDRQRSLGGDRVLSDRDLVEKCRQQLGGCTSHKRRRGVEDCVHHKERIFLYVSADDKIFVVQYSWYQIAELFKINLNLINTISKLPISN